MIIGVERAVGLEEDLLRQVLGQLTFAHHAHDEAVHGPLVAEDERAERVLGAAQNPGDELGVGDRPSPERRDPPGPDEAASTTPPSRGQPMRDAAAKKRGVLERPAWEG